MSKEKKGHRRYIQRQKIKRETKQERVERIRKIAKERERDSEIVTEGGRKRLKGEEKQSDKEIGRTR